MSLMVFNRLCDEIDRRSKKIGTIKTKRRLAPTYAELSEVIRMSFFAGCRLSSGCGLSGGRDADLATVQYLDRDTILHQDDHGL